MRVGARKERSRKPNVEIAIAAATKRSAPEPKSRRTASAAGVEVAASPSRPSARRYTKLTATYTRITRTVPATAARGSVRRGSRVSSATRFALCQPPYEKRIGTSAPPNARRPAAGRTGPAVEPGMCGASASPPTTSVASARILSPTRAGAGRRGRGGGPGQVRRERQPADDERREREDLEPDEGVQEPAARLHAEDVDPGQNRDGGDRQRRRRRSCLPDEPQRVLRERDRDGRDPAPLDQE